MGDQPTPPYVRERRRAVRDAIAIVAAECIFPGADGYSEFKRINIGSRQYIGAAPEEFWKGTEILGDAQNSVGKVDSDLGGFLNDFAVRSESFRISPRTVRLLDPVHALALEVARRTFASTEGLVNVDRSRTAVVLANVFGGRHSQTDAGMHMQSQRWAEALREKHPELSAAIDVNQARTSKLFPHRQEELALNSESGTIAGRVANAFDLRGSHFTVDAACAGSLAALDAASQLLRARTVDLVLAGGVGRLTPDEIAINTAAGSTSASGCRPFDAAADGLIHGEGGGMVLLKRLDDALSANEKVLGVIRAIGYSVNGRRSTGWKPSLESEVEAINCAFDKVDFSPAEVDYVEAHGTSTAIGDRIEFEAMELTYGKSPRESPLPFGSSKSVFGHTVEAAGIAGLLRALTIIDLGELVSHPGVSDVAPFVRESVTLKLQQTTRPLEQSSTRPIRVGVSGFGYGGINYHALIEGPSPAAGISASSDLVGSIAAESVNIASGGTELLPRDALCEPVAIVAMDFVAPGAQDLDEFWQRILNKSAPSACLSEADKGVEFFSRIGLPNSSGLYCDRYQPAPKRDFSDFMGMRISPAKYQSLSEELKLLVESTARMFHQIESACSGVPKSRRGCIVGEMPDSDEGVAHAVSLRLKPYLDSLLVLAGDPSLPTSVDLAKELALDSRFTFPSISSDTSVAGLGSRLASTLCESLDFRGKSYAVRAACASSLAALAAAVRELRSGDLDVVLCSAVGLGLGLENQSSMAAIGALSRDGVVRPYDREGTGFLMGGGGGGLLLKRLTDAEAHGDEIVAVIRDVQGAGDGNRASLLATTTEGRVEAMRRAYEATGLSADEVEYWEGHGAATELGDKTEIEAISVLRSPTAPGAVVGSVKGNVGHMMAAAGMAALVKTALSLKNEIMGPTAGFRSERPGLDLRNRRLTVLESPRSWPGRKRLAGVSSSGLGGINYHVVMESYEPPVGPRGDVQATERPSPSSAHRALGTAIWAAETRRQLLNAVRNNPGGRTARVLPSTGQWRACVTASDVAWDAAVRDLIADLQGSTMIGHTATYSFAGTGVEKRKLCFLYPGQGSQFPGMVSAALAELPSLGYLLSVASETFPSDEPRFERMLIRRDESARDWLGETTNTQPATLLASWAVGDHLASLGIEADVHLGHSFGEITGLARAGSFSFADGLWLARQRGLAMNGVGAEGSQPEAMMAAVGDIGGVTEADLRGKTVYVANRNSPDQLVLSGIAQDLAAIAEVLEARGIKCITLDISKAFHSPLAASAIPVFHKALSAIEIQPPRSRVFNALQSRPYEDSVSGADIRRALSQELMNPVDFVTMVKNAYKLNCVDFVEVGPGSALSSLVTKILSNKADAVRAIPSLARKITPEASLTRMRANLWVWGYLHQRH